MNQQHQNTPELNSSDSVKASKEARKTARKQKRMRQYGRAAGTFLFILAMLAGMVTGWMGFARPSVSSIEKRELTAFPALSFASVMDGSFFSQVALWYSDTFPGRETLIAADQKMENLYGFAGSVQVYGGATADEIPTDHTAADSTQDDTDSKERVIPDTYTVAEDVQNQVTQGLLVKDGAVYGGAYFIQESADNYVNMVNNAAKELEGITQVYSILIPNNSGIMLDEATREGLGGSDQKQMIEYFYSGYDDSVKTVETFDTLSAHSDEYLYFRTDHHWTALGAYYVYQSFANTKGIEAHDLSEYETVTYEPFVGSYQSTLPYASLTPDTLTGYIPLSTNTEKIYLDSDDDGKVSLTETESYEHPIFNTDENIDMYSQYMRFIGGDQGFIEIDNPEINDGSSCLVIKESFGNALIPFLVDHYDKVYVVDFRYSAGGIVTFCKENNVTDLIFCNNIQLASATTVAPAIEALLN